jgi:Sushi repeat (SCR repeat)
MGTGRQYGDRVRYACSAGYRLIGADDSTCQADGTWSTASPQCEGSVVPVQAIQILPFADWFLLNAPISISQL